MIDAVGAKPLHVYHHMDKPLRANASPLLRNVVEKSRNNALELIGMFHIR
jgi:hypothetical protein